MPETTSQKDNEDVNQQSQIKDPNTLEQQENSRTFSLNRVQEIGM